MGGGFLEGLGFAFGAYGENQAANAQSQALGKQAAAAKDNAHLAIFKAQAEAENQVIQSRAILGKQTADYSAGNLGGQSVFGVMADSATNAEMDRLNILFSGKIKSNQFLAESSAKHQAGVDVSNANTWKILSMGFQEGGKMAAS